jgi:hypothetical protein
MAEKMQERAREREATEKTLLSRSWQQTVVSALGQFALVSTDLTATVNQAVMMISQTLDVEYCAVLKLSQDKSSLSLQAGVGWKSEVADQFERTCGTRDLGGPDAKRRRACNHAESAGG